MSNPRIPFTLRQRIYISMLALILLSFVATGITAYINFKQQEEEYNFARLSRKELAIQESMRYFLEQKGGYIQTAEVPSLFTDKICELSDVHNLAINFYNLRGDLLISSSSDNIDRLGFPMKIDYTIMKQLSTGNSRAQKTHDIDHGTYIMAYWYFRNADGAPVAITNVRYDKREVDSAELNAFLLQLTKIYVVLFIGASLLAYVLSNYITSSLQKVASKLQELNISKRNEPLEWHGKDEIGALVTEYNRMMKEVEASAAELAKSERESAWREMAKQVAHEIKNPLTPMKLRVQHLERSLDPDDPEYADKLTKFSSSMVEQIDALSAIASEFSDFAKMPLASKKDVNLLDVVRSSVEVYKEPENAELRFEDHGIQFARVYLDPEHFLRVLNNLIANAIQAIPEGRSGIIDVSLQEEKNEYHLMVKDNGSGIPASMQAKIFQPYFTTKTHGTGLGLAMVKNIVENSNGTIRFETEAEVGTTFHITLPKHEG